LTDFHKTDNHKTDNHKTDNHKTDSHKTAYKRSQLPSSLPNWLYRFLRTDDLLKFSLKPLFLTPSGVNPSL
jgi:hypothetical protein